MKQINCIILSFINIKNKFVYYYWIIINKMISVYSDASVSSKSLKLSANSTFHELSSKENQINDIQKQIKELKLKIKQIQDSVEILSNY